MSAPLDSRPPARTAGPELLVLQRWEESAGFLLAHTERWPKSARFTLAQRIQNHALDVVEMLAEARYEPGQRARLLKEANLRFERMRLLLRIARGAGIESKPGFEGALRRIDEAGRMVYGWRQTLGLRGGRTGTAATPPGEASLFPTTDPPPSSTPPPTPAEHGA